MRLRTGENSGNDYVVTVKETHTKNVRLEQVSENYFRTVDSPRLHTNSYKLSESEEADSLRYAASYAGDSSGPGLCTLCLTSVANAVLMKCGHGGLCKPCAITMMQSERPCFLCREEIQYVYEVNSRAVVKATVQIDSKTSLTYNGP